MYSIETRIKALAVAGLMAASVAGSTVTAFAAATAQDASNGVSVTKNVYYPAQGVTPAMPENVVAFGFTATFVKSSLTGVAGSKVNRGNAPQTFTGTVDPGNWTNASNGSWTSSYAVVTPAASEGQTWSWNNVTPGCYEYDLTEDKMGSGNNATYQSLDQYGFGWTFNSPVTTYRLRVYVSAKYDTATKTYSKTERTVKYTLVDTSKVDGQTEGTGGYNAYKATTASFSNIYTVRGGSKTPGVPSGQEDPALTVSKTANGEFDDQTKSFDFYISFTYPTVAGTEVKPTSTEEGAVDGILAKSGENYVSEFTKVTDNTNLGDYKFSLTNGQKIAFVNLPAGTTYTITEAADSQYKVSGMKVVSNNDEKTDSGVSSAKVGTAYKAMANTNNGWILIGEKHNEINFTNTRDSITITGVVTHSAPFVIMVGALFVAVGGYVVLKKRIEE